MTVEDTLGLVGTMVDDKYLVEECVGAGGFAIVYRARHKLWQKPVALKCFKTMTEASGAAREKLLRDFVQEGALLTELSARSASIVQARDIGTMTTPTGAWVPYMVLEWLEGSSLEGVIEQSGHAPWSLEVTLGVLEPIADALEVAHRKNITHRDVKPANIFLVGPAPRPTDNILPNEMQVKLLDFGIAKVVESAAQQGFTQTGSAPTSFTPAYGAPEQFSRARGATGPWTDVYALALIFSEMLSGKYALEGDDFIQLGMATADPHRRPTPRTLGAPISDALESVLAKALSVATTDRYPTAGEFWDAVRGALGAAPRRSIDMTSRPMRADRAALAQTEANPNRDTATPSMALAGAPASSSIPKKSRGLVIVGVTCLLGVAGVGVFFATRKAPSAAEKGEEKEKVEPKAKAAPSASPAASASANTKPGCPKGMAEIAGGSSFIGSDTGDPVEKPAHKVKLDPYCMDIHEVTVSAYKACSDSGDCKRAWAVVDWPDVTEREKKIYTPLCNINDPVGKAQHPINCVDWQMAVTYCESVDARLPTEAEWEFAARGPDGRIYPWGDEPPDHTHLNACGAECLAWGKANGETVRAMYPGDDKFPNTAPVGSFPKGASRYGLLDVVGNVWEWTADWDGPYSAAESTNPKGPDKGTDRIVRGGAWNGAMVSWVRPSQRYSFTPQTKSHAVGFRCARTLSAPPKPKKSAE